MIIWSQSIELTINLVFKGSFTCTFYDFQRIEGEVHHHFQDNHLPFVLSGHYQHNLLTDEELYFSTHSELLISLFVVSSKN